MGVPTLTKKTWKVSRGYTYTYYAVPAQDSKPTLILFHGWPDSASLWVAFINDYLIPHGYGAIAPDCLGYGETDTATDLEAYGWQHMSADFIEIIDAEKVSKVISVGHDFGSGMCQRLYSFYPSRVSGLVMINVAYGPAGVPFDLDAVNKATKEMLGYGVFEYWYFYTAEDSADIMRNNLEAVYTLAHGDPKTWVQNICTPGATRAWVSGGRTQPTLPYATPEHKAEWMQAFGKANSFDGPNSWYKAMRFGMQAEAEKLIPEEGKKVNVPALFWAGEDDAVCRPAVIQPPIDAGFLPDIKVVTRKGGHWAFLEKPEVFGQDMISWLEETYAK